MKKRDAIIFTGHSGYTYGYALAAGDGATAVDRQAYAGDVVILGEEEDRLADVLGSAFPLQPV